MAYTLYDIHVPKYRADRIAWLLKLYPTKKVEYCKLTHKRLGQIIYWHQRNTQNR